MFSLEGSCISPLAGAGVLEMQTLGKSILKMQMLEMNLSPSCEPSFLTLVFFYIKISKRISRATFKHTYQSQLDAGKLQKQVPPSTFIKNTYLSIFEKETQKEERERGRERDLPFSGSPSKCLWTARSQELRSSM